jgi:RHS repeat-associated protein
MSDQKGIVAEYVYNALGDLTTLISSDTGTSTFEYDNAGSRKARLDARGIASNFSYDAMARVTGVSYPTSPALDVEYAYDAVQGGCRAYERFAQGRLTFMSDHSGTTRYCYDRGGGIARKIQRAGGTELAVAYGRNKAGAVTSVTYPDGSVVDYVRSENGDVSEVGVTLMGGSRQVLAGNVTHLPFGAVSGWIFGNGRSMQRPQTLDYRADKIVDSGVGGLSLGFFYDAVGNVRRIEDAFGSSILSRYRYDDFYRLADVQDGPTGTLLERYAYDLSGDRMTLKNSTGTTQYLYGEANHHLLEVNGIGRAYDEAGDTIRIGGAARQFVYDASGRLARAKSDGAILMNYRYNGLGQQVWRYSAPDAPDQRFTAYDEDGRWLGDYGADGVPIQQMVWLDELPIGLLVGAGAQQQLAYVEPDHLGTPRVVIDVARDMPVWSWDIRGEVFGATPPNEDPDGDGAPFVFDMRYPGQRYDAASGLNQNGFRDYEPETGRYVESDPIGTKVGLNTYAYASGDPTSRLDPLGLADIYIWMPLPYTGGIPSYGKLHSAFGHVSVDANGQSFSFGPRGNSVDFWYASRQHQIRNAIVHHLPLSESQEKALANCLAKDQGKYNGVSNNCGSPLQNCMRNIGMPLSAFNAIFPETLNMMLYVNPAVTESYPLYRGEP